MAASDIAPVATAPEDTPQPAAHRRRRDDNTRVPKELRYVLLVLGALGIGGGGAAGIINWPFEDKKEAAAVHTKLQENDEKLQKQIDSLKTDIPAATVRAMGEAYLLRKRP